jgi:DNA polymerase Ligase (LigD)
MGRYVILRHDFATRHNVVHWDLMVESGTALRTWALDEAPAAGVVIAAEQLPDHRLAYLDYEGPVSGDRGSVSRWDTGQFTILSDSPGRLAVRLTGNLLDGVATLSRPSEGTRVWKFTFEPQAPDS